MCLAALLSFSGSLFSQPSDNLQFLTRLSDGLITRIVNHHVNPGIDVVISSLEKTNPNNWFIEDRLVAALTAPDRTIYLNPERATAVLKDSAAVRIEYRLQSMGVKYQDSSESPAMMRRKGHLNLFLRIIGVPSGGVTWSGNLDSTDTQLLRAEDISGIENQSIPFTVGQMVDDKEHASILQPLLVSVATGVIVYLFYALRSR